MRSMTRWNGSTLGSRPAGVGPISPTWIHAVASHCGLARWMNAKVRPSTTTSAAGCPAPFPAQDAPQVDQIDFVVLIHGVRLCNGAKNGVLRAYAADGHADRRLGNNRVQACSTRHSAMKPKLVQVNACGAKGDIKQA